MKPPRSDNALAGLGRPPRGGRGLKQVVAASRQVNALVAPRAGAWIETLRRGQSPRRPQVAPRAGAWIETPHLQTVPSTTLRRPPRGGVD